MQKYRTNIKPDTCLIPCKGVKMESYTWELYSFCEAGFHSLFHSLFTYPNKTFCLFSWQIP